MQVRQPMVRVGLPSASGVATGLVVAVLILALFPRAGILGSVRCPTPKTAVTEEQVRTAQMELANNKEEMQRLAQQLAQQKTAAAHAERSLQEAAGLKKQLDAAKQEVQALKQDVEKLNAEAAKASAAGGKGGWRKPMAIPRILHHNFNNNDIPTHYKDWMSNCKLLMREEQGWQYMLWNQSMSEELIGKHDPDFLEIFKKYTRNVQRSDSLRYFIMKHIGGLYVDADVECWREGSDMLEGYDVVLQGDYPGHAATNGVLASAAGHPLWDIAIQLLRERKDHDPNDLGHSTGPQIVRDAVKRLLNISLDGNGLLPSDLVHSDGTKIKVWQIGEWFTPCGFSSWDCHKDVMLQRATGRVNLTHLVGMHRYTGSWLGFTEGQHPINPDQLKQVVLKEKKEGQ